MKKRTLVGLGVLTSFSFFCSSADLMKKNSKNLSIAKAIPKKSIALKRKCKPLGFLTNVNQQQAVIFATKNKVDTIQIFHEDKIAINDIKYDLRFWRCKVKKVIKEGQKIVLTNENRKKKKYADVLFLNFFNAAQKDDFNWVSSSVPEAINVTMQGMFKYKIKQISVIQNKKSAYTISYLKKISKQYDIDIIVFGDFTFNSSEEKLSLISKVYYSKEKKVIGQTKVTSKADITLFQATNSLADKIVKKIYQFETKK